MRYYFVFILLSFYSGFVVAQDNCDSGYFLVNEGSKKVFSISEIERAFKSLDKNCIDNNAEYSEMVNEFVFHCITYSSDSFFKVLNSDIDSTFYNIVLYELENPISDIYEFEVLYCNVANYNINQSNKVGKDVLFVTKKWICNFVTECDSIAIKGCN